MSNPVGLDDGLTSSGICTRCQQDLIQVGDTLGCPECGDHVLISVLHTVLRLKAPRARFDSGMLPSPVNPSSHRPAPPPKPSSNFTELWKRLNNPRK
jgi:DNA-directed RNA polymerase subunit RPC12/RpoP